MEDEICICIFTAAQKQKKVFWEANILFSIIVKKIRHSEFYSDSKLILFLSFTLFFRVLKMYRNENKFCKSSNFNFNFNFKNRKTGNQPFSLTSTLTKFLGKKKVFFWKFFLWKNSLLKLLVFNERRITFSYDWIIF